MIIVGFEHTEITRRRLRNRVDRQRIPADQPRRQDLVHMGFDRRRPVEGFAKANQPFVSVDPHPKQVRVLAYPERLDCGYLHCTPGQY